MEKFLLYFLLLGVGSTLLMCKDDDSSSDEKEQERKIIVNDPNKLDKGITLKVIKRADRIGYNFDRFTKTTINGVVRAADCEGTKVSFTATDGEDKAEAELDESCVFDFEEVTNQEGNLAVTKFGYAPVYKKIPAVTIEEEIPGTLPDEIREVLTLGSVSIDMKPADLTTEFIKLTDERKFELDNGYIVIVAPGSLLYEDGSVVEKEVRFSITSIRSAQDYMWMPPMDATITQPDGTTVEGQLNSQAMMYITIEDEDGKVIQDVDPEKPITIGYPIPQSQEDRAEQMPPVPYWYFNHLSFKWENIEDPDGNIVDFEVGTFEGHCAKYFISRKITKVY